jgi:hypothetical protein
MIKLLAWCESRHISLLGENLPGEDNQLADALSRGGVQSSAFKRIRGSSVEWHLLPRVCRPIFLRMDRPHIDLFASKHNHQLPKYFSWEQDPLSMGRNALSQDWSGLLAYAFPPIALIPRLLLKLSQTANCHILLVAPHWPRQAWFSRLLDLLVSEPVLLPISPELLCILATKERVPLHVIEGLKLTVWPISADLLSRQAFLRRLPISHRRQGDLQPERLTLRGSRGSVGGADASHVTHILHL